LDRRIVALLALAGLFGFFTFAMTATSLRFVFTNITNIDMLKKTQTYRLAVRVPSNTISNEQFQTITYPLSNPNFGPNGEQLGEGAGPDSASSLNVLSPRDQQAKRTFAILTMEPGQNPWDQGYWKNWKTVMGNNVFEWFLPIHYSPCCNHDSMVSDYEFGPLLDEMKQKYGIPDTETPTKGGIEMRNSPTSRQ
jgi:palmitoyltransferase